jgi:putative peptide zinc metalloprotease protein
MRPDLMVVERRLGGRRMWIVKDPLAMRYFQLRDEEFSLLRMLDGQNGFAEIKERFEQRFVPARVDLRRLELLVSRFYRDGLVLAEASGQGEELLARSRQARRSSLFASTVNVLAIRFPGVDPQRFLDWLYPKCRWMFSSACAAACLALVAAAVMLVLTELSQLQNRLPEIEAFFRPSNLFWLALALAGTKVLHELGHGLMCRHFGGRCHEMGLMLLVFTPCLYCNVSDAWMLGNRWQRAAVAAAGIYVEVTLAAICTLLWWFTYPGVFHSFCFNVMVVCGLGTILLNGNPLLRYDGYFVLADALDVPNLWQRSRAIIWSTCLWLCLRIDTRREEDDDLSWRHRAGLGAYALASIIYRWVVLLGIVVFLFSTLRLYRLELLAQLLVLLVALGVFMMPIDAARRWLAHPSNADRLWSRTTLLRMIGLAAAVVAILLVPLPHRMTVPIVLEREQADAVYVLAPGTLVSSRQIGDQVAAGAVIAELDNPDLRREVARLSGDLAQREARLTVLETRRSFDSRAAAEIPTAREELEDLKQQFAQRQLDLVRLTLRAPRDGTVLSPPPVPAKRNPDGRLSGWSGTPLDEANLGCQLETGTLVCLVGDPDTFRCVAFVNQRDVSLVRVGQRGAIHLEQLPDVSLQGTVEEVARLDLDATPPELLVRAQIPTRIDSAGVARPLEVFYRVRIALSACDASLVDRGGGHVTIRVSPKSVAWRIQHWFRQVFRVA